MNKSFVFPHSCHEVVFTPKNRLTLPRAFHLRIVRCKFFRKVFPVCSRRGTMTKIASFLSSGLREKKNAVYFFQISLFVPEIFEFLKYANYQVMTSYTQTKFCSNMIKRDISANLYQNFLQ